MESRYDRNIGAFEPEEMERIRRKNVCIAGCGGLGGYVLEELLRAGVGSITAVDGDRFEESNLNRQLLCTMENIGCGKAEEARLRGRKVNPDVAVRPVWEYLTRNNAAEILQGADAAVDALDSPESRLILAEACESLKIPLIHGAIGTWYAQAAVILPGSGLMQRLYVPEDRAAGSSTLSFVPALCASVQAAETLKILAGRESVLAGKVLLMDLKRQEYELLPL